MIYEDVAGFVIPRWRGGVEGSAPPVCLAPWRSASAEVARLIVDAVGVGVDDVFVDLGSGDGSVVMAVSSMTGCVGVGVEVSVPLVRLARATAVSSSVGPRAADRNNRNVFLHELIGTRGLAGATVVYVWLLGGGLDVVVGLIAEAVAVGSVRAVVTVGDVAAFEPLGVFREVGLVSALRAGEVVGSVPLSVSRVGGGGVDWRDSGVGRIGLDGGC